jgi:hypothetical protein
MKPTANLEGVPPVRDRKNTRLARRGSKNELSILAGAPVLRAGHRNCSNSLRKMP